MQVYKQHSNSLTNNQSDSNYQQTNQQYLNNNFQINSQQLDNHLNKEYTKDEFIQIINQLNQQDPLYYCQYQHLQMIYQKTIEYQSKFTGLSLTQFAKALKQKNKQKFTQQLKFYTNYINHYKQINQINIQRKQLLNSVYLNQQVGYLTGSVYEMVRQQQYIQIDKLQQLITQVQTQFKQFQRVSIPRKVLIKKTVYLEQKGQQQFQQQIIFQLSQSVSKQQIDLQKVKALKQQILQYIQNQVVSQNIQRQFNKLQQSITTINKQTIPSLKQQLTTVKQYNTHLQQQLTTLYQQLQTKHSQLITSKNSILQLTQQNRLINRQLINTKITINQKDQLIYQLQTDYVKAQNQALQLKNKTQTFFNQYTNLKTQYQNFIQQVKLQQERKTLLQQNNLLPTISLKQQLEDAQFKIRKLKSDKQQLLKDMQTNQNIFAAKLITLQKQLQQAKLNANKTQQLKFTGMSRLSKNYQYFRNSKSIIRKSINQSLLSVLIDTRSPPQSNKMSTYIQQVDDYMMSQSKRDKTQYNNKQSIVMPVNMKGTKLKIKNNTSNQQQQSINNKSHQQKYQSQFQDFFQTQFNRQSKLQQPKYNFTQIDYQQLRRRWKNQDPDLLNDQKIQSLQQQQQNHSQQTVDVQQHLNLQQLQQTYTKTKPQTMFISSVDVISKSGIKYKKYLLFNRKGVFMFDTKLRLQKIFKYTKIHKITFTYYNLDTFVVSFKRKQSPMKKKSINHDGDLIFKCLRTKQLLSFLSQPLFRQFILKQAIVKVMIQKQSNIWVHDSNDKDMVLTHCGSFYNPFRLNLSLKNQHNKMFYAQLSRQNYFSRSYIIICIVQQFGVYCFEWNEDELQKEKKFIYLLPLVKRLVFIREVESDTVKIVYQDWSDGKTFLLRFKNNKQSLKFQTMCKHQLKVNLNVLQNRKKTIENLFEIEQPKSNQISPQKYF